jgi:predicted  nucleic acid-binding Zn-ribbon protein
MTKAQEVYERVEAIVASGVRKADAFRQVAEEFGQPFNSMRGAYYAHTRAIGQASTAGPRRTRKRETTTEDAIEQATIVLNRAIAAIDAEIELAKTRANEAKAEYEHLRDNAEERKTTIQAKITALAG